MIRTGPGAIPVRRKLALPAAVRPLGCGFRHTPQRPNVLAGGVDPRSQSRPRTQKRLVGYLDRGLAGRGVAVERQQAMPPERVEGRPHRLGLDLEAGELGPRHPASGVGGPFAEGHETQEELAHRFATGLVPRRVQLLGPRGQRPGYTADVPVGGEREPSVVPPLEELGEGVLHERKRPGLFGDVRRHLGDEGGLDVGDRAARRARRSPARARRARAASRPRCSPRAARRSAGS